MRSLRLERCITGYGVEEDEDEAMEWYRKAAEQGHADAQYALGQCYDVEEYGIEPDDAKAVEWYRKAVEQGNESAN